MDSLILRITFHLLLHTLHHRLLLIRVQSQLCVLRNLLTWFFLFNKFFLFFLLIFIINIVLILTCSPIDHLVDHIHLTFISNLIWIVFKFLFCFSHFSLLCLLFLCIFVGSQISFRNDGFLDVGVQSIKERMTQGFFCCKSLRRFKPQKSFQKRKWFLRHFSKINLNKVFTLSKVSGLLNCGNFIPKNRGFLMKASCCSLFRDPRIFCMTNNWSMSLSPGNNGWPSVSSPNMQPMAHMSAGGPYSRFKSSSGDRYHRVAT